MIIHRGFRFKLQPTGEQELLFTQFAGVCRFVYNLALEQREKYHDTYSYRGMSINFAQQCRELTMLREQVAWIAAVPSVCEEQALRDLDKAFSNFFSGRSRYPTRRKKGAHETFRFKGRELSFRPLNSKWAMVRFPKVGWVKFRSTRPIDGRVKTATVTLDALGWHIAFACEIEAPDETRSAPSVGIDRGVATTLMLSTGESFSVPATLSMVDGRFRKAQRVAARRARQSGRGKKAALIRNRLSARRARIRKDWVHRISKGIADRFQYVVMEELKVASMTASAKGTIESPGVNVAQKTGLNRSILNQGWGLFAEVLEYKLEKRGGRLIFVDPAYTSQTCSECGTVDKRSRKSQAVFHCLHCGFDAHADQNAAINILRRNTASMGVEDGHRLSVETLTGSGFTAAENQPA